MADEIKIESKVIRSVIEAPEEKREIVGKLLLMKGVKVELCGSWLWVSGATYSHAAELKEAGCKWSARKRMWYYTEKMGKYHKYMTMPQIREHFGSVEFAEEA